MSPEKVTKFFTDHENERIEEFFMRHYECDKNGTKIRLTCKPTGVGTSIVVSCRKCKMKEDISDYENW